MDAIVKPREIYPSSCSRTNAYSSVYAEIAIDHFINLCTLNPKINKEKYWGDEIIAMEIEHDKKVLITVVFAEMALEAFFNNYAAACLGDDEFYNSFDKLSLVNKFKLIVKFIIKTNIDTTQSYYSSLCELERNRNKIVHNKSKKFQLPLDIYIDNEDDAFTKIEDGIIDKSHFSGIKEDYNMAKKAICSLKWISLFFEKYDLNYHRFFLSLGAPYDNSEKSNQKKKLLKELGLEERYEISI